MQNQQLSHNLKNQQHRHLSPRRGVVLLQAILVLPILVIITLAGIQIAMVMQVQQTVSSAVLEASRTAANGGNFEEVVNVIRRIMEIHEIDVDEEGCCLIELEQASQPTQRHGRTDFAGRRDFPPLRAGQIRVNLFMATSGPNGRPVPDWLRTFGFSWSNRVLSGSATRTVE